MTKIENQNYAYLSTTKTGQNFELQFAVAALGIMQLALGTMQ